MEKKTTLLSGEFGHHSGLCLGKLAGPRAVFDPCIMTSLTAQGPEDAYTEAPLFDQLLSSPGVLEGERCRSGTGPWVREGKGGERS